MQQAMSALGMFCLGCFVGGVVCTGLSLMDSLDGFLKALIPILGAAVSGVVLQFAKNVEPNNPASVAPYPVGLLLALLWSYVGHASDRIEKREGAGKVYGWLHVVALGLISVVALVVFVWPVLRGLFS